MAAAIIGHGNPVHPGDHWRTEITHAEQALPGITVEELTQLANAGVKIDLKDVAQYVRPSPKPAVIFDATRLTKPLLQRWKQFQEIKHGTNHYFDHKYPFFLSAWANGDTVYVFVCPENLKCEPMILTDAALTYPSDTLMAKIHLMMETQPNLGVQVEQPMAGVQSQAKPAYPRTP